MTAVRLLLRGDDRPHPRQWPPALLAGLTAAGLGAAVTMSPPQFVIAAVLVVVIGGAVMLRPAFGAYLIVAATPLVGGIDRGVLLPLLRPSEAVALVVAVALVPAALQQAHRAGGVWLTRVDTALILLAFTGSVMPLAWMTVRGEAIEKDDVLYAIQLWKYYALFVIFRISVRTEREVRVTLWTAMVTGSLVAVIAILQSLQLFGVPALLATFYAPFDDASLLDIKRGTSTLASSAAVADVMVFCMAIAAGWLLLIRTHRLALTALFVVFVLGAIAAGQFSGYVGILVGIAALGFITRRLGRLSLSFMPVAIVGALALWPVLERRLAGFDTASGLPQSWEARLRNLEVHFWPKLQEGYNWLLGVRPAARVPNPDAFPGNFIFIESGHTWLLWIGGVPFTLAFFVFLFVAMRATGGRTRERADAIGVAAAASFTALAVLAVLTTTDPHLTLRGAAELSFALLALAMTRGVRGHVPS